MTTVTAHRDLLAILDVGHGNCAVILLADWTAVIDAGPKIWLQRFLASRNVSSVNEVFLSHPDRDHIAGLVQLVASRKFRIHRVWVNENVDKDTDLWDDLCYELNDAQKTGDVTFERILTRESCPSCGHQGTEIQTLHPGRSFLTRYQQRGSPVSARISGHSVNAVFRVVKNSKPVVVFLGDLDQRGLMELCSAGIDIMTPVMVFPHHGGGAGTSDLGAFVARLCATIHPETVVFSIGRGVHDTPGPDILSAILKYVPSARVVCTQLSSHCAKSLPFQEPLHLAPLFARGREHRSCCAGSVAIDLEDFQITPLDEEHRAFIEQHAPTALCRNFTRISQLQR